MSSTELIITSWKQEPLSPPSEQETTWVSSPEEELFIYSSLEQDVDFKLEAEDLYSSCETKAEVASQLLENLENLIDLDELIKEEPFFLDVKMLPVLDEMEQGRFNPSKFDSSSYRATTNSNEFINEFDPVPLCNMIEYAPTPVTLTPPQSPPNSERPMLTTLKPLVTSAFQIFQDEQQTPQASPSGLIPENKQEPQHQLLDNVQLVYPNMVTPQPDIAHELSIVDELVRSRVENMQWRSSSSSPCSSSICSNSNSSFEDSSAFSDPEWVPDALENSDEKTAPAALKSATTRKRTKPYSRNVEDKKSRKKEQNKNAATRYRMKKKAEVEEILSEEKKLAQEGEKLSNKITEIQREIKYLKGLMRDLFKAKGLIN